MNDAQTVWIKRHNQSFIINAIFVDDVLHCTNDPAQYRALRKRFEKRFDPIWAIAFFMTVLKDP